MSVANTQVRARINTDIKKRASEALADMGLTLSDGIRIFLVHVANEKRLPFEVRVPNSDTRAAMDELASGGGKTFDTLDELMADLHAED